MLSSSSPALLEVWADSGLMQSSSMGEVCFVWGQLAVSPRGQLCCVLLARLPPQALAQGREMGTSVSTVTFGSILASPGFCHSLAM